MNKPVVYFIAAIVALSLLAMATPLLVALSNALVPLVVVGGIAVVAVRLVFFHTRRW